MVKLLRRTHTILYFAAVLLFFIPCFPILYFFTRYPQKYYRQIVFVRKWISLCATTLVGIRFVVRSETPIDWSHPYIICPNHTSILDITAINYLCPQSFSFMGKIELLNNPVTGVFFKSIDIVVNRKSKISAFKAFKKADTYVKEGKSVVIFPEGKIDDDFPPTLHEFKSGSFRIAVENNIQILPVVIHDSWMTLWDNGLVFGSKPGTIHISILSPIDTNNYDVCDVEELQNTVYQNMHEHWLHQTLFATVKKPRHKNT